MKDFSKEVLAYSLQNAIEFGKADPSKIIGKLFQHGLDKKNIDKMRPVIEKAVKKVNSMKAEERVKAFGKLKDFVKERVYEEKGLEELPGSAIKKKMVFRVAPFPSGALHIGNAKTFILNVLYAEKYFGDLILVMDDTIGSAKKPLAKEGYRLIEDAFKWLKVRYKKPIVYKSDRLKIYYKYAKELIEKGKVYVCYCSPEELRANRAKSAECGCRQFPKGMQMLRWKEMFDVDEGHATLRIKTNMTHPNPAFRDRVLFKVSDREHPKVGRKYRVWPSLEMSWSIDDHLLGITHIIRGNDLAMETEMEKYIWDIFRWKHPVTIHTGLIKIEGVSISKSKAQKEVLSGEFIGWDDPRTWSIQSLARRGITPEAIIEFVREIGLNKQDIVVPIESLYAANRRILDEEALRYSFVANPKKVEIKNVLSLKEVDIPIHPNTPEKTRKVKVSNNIFISGRDFKAYENKEVRLVHLFNIDLKEKTEVGSIENKKIPKLNWVADGGDVEVRVLMPNGGWVSGVAEDGIKKLKVGSIIQFERFGFCRFDGTNKDLYEFWFGHK